MTTLLKKISASDLMGVVAKFVRENMEVGDVKLAYGVAGICDSLEEGTGTLGDYTAFCGEFDAVNYVSGETFSAPKVYVPNVLESRLLSDLKDMRGVCKELDKKTVVQLTSTIEFAYTVSLKRNEDDEKGGVSYEYITTPKTEMKENARIKHLSAMLQLDAPKEEPKPAPKAKAKA